MKRFNIYLINIRRGNQPGDGARRHQGRRQIGRGKIGEMIDADKNLAYNSQFYNIKKMILFPDVGKMVISTKRWTEVGPKIVWGRGPKTSPPAY